MATFSVETRSTRKQKRCSMDEVLPSWNDGPARQAITAFIEESTSPGDGFIEPAERVAAFDNDGTLWISSRSRSSSTSFFGRSRQRPRAMLRWLESSPIRRFSSRTRDSS